MKQLKVNYHGQCMNLGEKQALVDLEKMIKEPIPIVSFIDTFKFGFIPIENHIARLGVPSKGLVSLLDSFCNLSSLQELVLFGNHLKVLPDSFGSLISLKFLNLVRNELIALPESFGKLTLLKILYLNNFFLFFSVIKKKDYGFHRS